MAAPEAPNLSDLTPLPLLDPLNDPQAFGVINGRYHEVSVYDALEMACDAGVDFSAIGQIIAPEKLDEDISGISEDKVLAINEAVQTTAEVGTAIKPESAITGLVMLSALKLGVSREVIRRAESDPDMLIGKTIQAVETKKRFDRKASEAKAVWDSLPKRPAETMQETLIADFVGPSSEDENANQRRLSNIRARVTVALGGDPDPKKKGKKYFFPSSDKVLDREVPEEVIDDIVLATSELCTNIWRHSPNGTGWFWLGTTEDGGVQIVAESETKSVIRLTKPREIFGDPSESGEGLSYLKKIGAASKFKLAGDQEAWQVSFIPDSSRFKSETTQFTHDEASQVKQSEVKDSDLAELMDQFGASEDDWDF